MSGQLFDHRNRPVRGTTLADERPVVQVFLDKDEAHDRMGFFVHVIFYPEVEGMMEARPRIARGVVHVGSERYAYNIQAVAEQLAEHQNRTLRQLGCDQDPREIGVLAVEAFEDLLHKIKTSQAGGGRA